jgi:hypothetical protein
LIYKRANPHEPTQKQWWEERTLTGSYADAASDCAAKVMALKPPCRVHLECHKYTPPVATPPCGNGGSAVDGVDIAYEKALAKLAARKKA